MRTLTSSALTSLLACFAFAAAACETPAMIPIPDGKTSSMEQLLAAQAQVKTYMAAMQQYLDCINGELDAQGETAPEEFKSLMVARNNSAVTEMESVAAAFNEQVRAYKAANPTPPKQ